MIMENIFKQNRVKIIALAILLVAGISSYLYSSKQNNTPVKGSQALAIEKVGLAEFKAENDTINNFSAQDKKVVEEMMPIFKEMGNAKDIEKNKQAAVSLGQIISKYPEYSDAYFLRATVLILTGGKDYQKILSDIDNAVKYHTSSKYQSAYSSTAGMYGLRAKVDMLADNYQQAISDLETAVKIDPSNTNEIFNTGGVKPEDESNSTALQKSDMDLLVSKYPTDYRTYLFRGMFYYSFTSFGEQYFTPALDNLSQALKVNPNSALANYLTGEVYQKEAFWSKAAASDISDLTGASGGYRERTNAIALQYFAQAEKVDPKFPYTYSQIAQQFYSLKKYSEAIPYYDKVVELQPENAGAYNDRALAKTYTNDYYDAISDFSKAVDLKKANPNISLGLDSTYENRAAAYLKVNNYDNAIQDYSRAIGLKFASQVFLMSVPQIRGLYPEFKDISDQDLLEGLRQKYFSNMTSADFVGNYQHDTINKTEDKKPFKDFVLGDLYTSRGDAYLTSGNFQKASKDYSRAVYEGSTSILDRWRSISKALGTEYFVDAQIMNFGPDNVSLWVKILNTNTQGYSQQNYQIDCAGRRIKSASATNYNSLGNVMFTSPVQDWQSIVPDSIGEMLYNGMCVSK